jgi:hypothetical protein
VLSNAGLRHESNVTTRMLMKNDDRLQGSPWMRYKQGDGRNISYWTFLPPTTIPPAGMMVVEPRYRTGCLLKMGQAGTTSSMTIKVRPRPVHRAMKMS